MGFWHTGYMEFHEPTGLSKSYESAPRVYRCELCGEEHLTLEALGRHRLEAHPFKRPVLFVAGREVPDIGLRVTTAITPGSIAFVNADAAKVNGLHVSLARLGAVLADRDRDRCVVELQNANVSSKFVIDVAVAKEEHLVGIEQEFLRIARAQRLDMRAIEGFIDTTNGCVTAAGYRDGICEYLYGVLAKERSADSSLPFREYRVKFNAAVNSLADFDRPLANTIRALVAFHFNHFELARELAKTQRVGVIAGQLQWLIKRQGLRPETTGLTHANADVERLLSDLQTEQILTWCTSSAPFAGREGQLEGLLQDDMAEFDRAKARLLIVEARIAAGDVTRAAPMAREVINDPTFGVWAQRVVDMGQDQLEVRNE